MGTVHLNSFESTLRVSEQINEIKMLFLQNGNNFQRPKQGEAIDSMFCISHFSSVVRTYLSQQYVPFFKEGKFLTLTKISAQKPSLPNYFM